MAIEALGAAHLPIAAVDIDRDALAVFDRNFQPVSAISTSISSMVDYHVYGRGYSAEWAYAPEILDRNLKPLVGRVDLVLAGPPCQGHSNLNNRTRRNDPRNQLYVAAAALAVALRPKMLVIENVPSVLSDSKEVVPTTHAVLERSGYWVSQGMLSVDKLGGPQTRKRHFMIATLTPHVHIEDVGRILEKPLPLTLWDVIADLEDKAYSDGFMDQFPALSDENRRRIAFLFEHGEYDLPDRERPICHRDGHSYPSVYGRLRRELPAPTITTGFMTPGRGRYIHPTRQRVLTAREAARVQGFPDTFDFSLGGTSPSKKLLSKWIGDAVPSILGYAAVLSALTSTQGTIGHS
jgi:DNA (cytosine-5)-methyltransferase 1